MYTYTYISYETQLLNITILVSYINIKITIISFIFEHNYLRKKKL